ncbi:MAG: ABC transporter ATP-binding protein [Candidatus Nitrohelix vancouverensis]|uniref:ABC transporter ATP-binding protein n=1 Tax=Candidatus Nitrohelix vancouverensis TaxID=2705534 RepID=A0A7T0G4J0_9BACT|nr:MAG: ABC transporter ATP-binding protein [Candidatus Nitrohelix vancouverensis]
MNVPELIVKNLKIEFSGRQKTVSAVNGISFHVNAGETVALVGESGCGKTVTALSILRLIPSPPGKISEGEIIFRSRTLLSLPAKEMRALRGSEISMVFQDPLTSLNPVLSIGEQLIETLLQHNEISRGDARIKAEELLRRVEIPSPASKLTQYPHQLSGGMRQRVMIAMALSCEPRLLIADEPTTALDVLIQAQILKLLVQLKEETGMSMLLITHDLGVVKSLAQRVIIMYAGDIVEIAPVAELLAHPHHPYTRGLIDSIPRPQNDPQASKRLKAISGNVPAPDARPSGCAFHPRCPIAVDRCRSEVPPLADIGPERSVRCWEAPFS